MATMKMVRRAATEERTGEVREMRTRKEPENAGNAVSTCSNIIWDEGLVLTCIGDYANGHHPGLLSDGEFEYFPARVV